MALRRWLGRDTAYAGRANCRQLYKVTVYWYRRTGYEALKKSNTRLQRLSGENTTSIFCKRGDPKRDPVIPLLPATSSNGPLSALSGAFLPSNHQYITYITSSSNQARVTMDDAPPNPFSNSPSTSPAPSRPLSPIPTPPSKPSSTISAASGSPPPTHRASFPDPSKEPKRGSSRLSGPLPKVDFCCDRDKEIHRGEEIGIVDAFKTTEGGKASYITYVIKLGVSFPLSPHV